MKILLSGGGTGGHVTPILALAHELKRLDPTCQIVYVGERKGAFAELTTESTAIDAQYTVFAGKFRRYHGEPWLRRVVDIRTNAKNLRDMLFVVVGFFQGLRLLAREKPKVVFLKGGYVGVPIGLAAALKRVPIVTHDSDAVPGLANRIVSRWTSLHAVALSPDDYNYPTGKTTQVGVLVEHNYQPVSTEMQKAFKRQLKLPEDEQLLLITGGSSGAERLNKAVVRVVGELLQTMPKLHVIHQVGKGKQAVYKDYTHERLQVLEFMSPMHVYTGAADLIVTRAGANSLAEFGVQGKACLIIPNPDLTGGHQTKNARRLKEQGAAEMLEEDELYDLQHGILPRIKALLADNTGRALLAGRLQEATIPDAAHKLATLLLEQANK